jgi:hypothetical protein
MRIKKTRQKKIENSLGCSDPLPGDYGLLGGAHTMNKIISN